MPQKIVLAYCVAEQQSEIDIPHSGVEEAPVRGIDVHVLRCFVSDFGSSMPDEPVPEMVKAFNRVLQRIFAQTAIIPFRFPTLVESEDLLRQFVESRSLEYGSALQRLRNKVQMDVRITVTPGGGAAGSSRQSQSGKDYLEDKRARYQQAQFILEEFRRVSDSLAEKWVQGDTSSGIRGFALVDRSSVPVFLEKIGRVLTPAGVSARITGPWPPSEFVEIAHE
jgi:Gas vesicle synthesis protein GvpL/GvpF